MQTKEKTQKILGNKGFIAFVGFLSAFVPMSTDLYLPALPKMVNILHTNIGLLNLTITCFFIFYAISMLFWGPLSDKFGRKKILLIGMIIYTIGSFLCLISTNVYLLISSRIIQAIGSGAAVAVATAMMKDVYTGKKLVAMLATVQSISMTTPVIAPIIGAFILQYTSWHGIFGVLAIVGVLGVIGSFLLTETLTTFSTGSVFTTLKNIKVVAKNPAFSILLFIFTITTLPMMAYITMSSYIYVNGFGLSDKFYTLFYSLTGLFLVIGPMLYVKLEKHFNSKKIITFSFAFMVISGVLIATVGTFHPITFSLSLIPAMMFGNMLRPPSTHLMLAQQDTNIGSASSLISFANTFMGSIGMIVITFNMGSKIVDIGVMYIITAAIALVLWFIFNNKPYIKQVSH